MRNGLHEWLFRLSNSIFALNSYSVAVSCVLGQAVGTVPNSDVQSECHMESRQVVLYGGNNVREL